jgi:hypothetical protein
VDVVVQILDLHQTPITFQVEEVAVLAVKDKMLVLMVLPMQEMVVLVNHFQILLILIASLHHTFQV